MVLLFKKDWSADLSYSSLAQDEKAWSSKGFQWSHTTRANIGFPSQQSVSVPAAASFTKKVAVDRDYAPKLDIAREVSLSPRRYSVMKSEERRDVDSVALLHSDTRHVRAFSPTGQLGPGSYLGASMKGRSGANPKPGTRSSTRGSSNFMSPERLASNEPDLPPLSDALTRDSKDWTSHGFYSSRSPRAVSTSSFWESGTPSRPTQATGGLLRLAQKQRTPAFDTMYDNQQHKDISRDVSNSPLRYSTAFRSQQMRLANKPTARTNDSRMRSESNCMGESGRELGPGYYEHPMTLDGRSITPGGLLSPESLLSMSRVRHGGGTGHMFSSGFRGPVSGRSTGMSMRGEGSGASLNNYGGMNSPTRSFSSMGVPIQNHPLSP
mmetsp:Transcript_38427/g.95331  ORF Transcript_38427/g.95331 Transcript_38427/m.95331 type:complete len:380 (-) Transcript_38427:1491-2630(-)